MPEIETTAKETLSSLFGGDNPNCIKCGLCLPHCPTYRETGLEPDSPRGRIALIQGVAAGVFPISAITHQMYFCLDCRACETVCPSGIKMGVLVEAARAEVEKRRHYKILPRLFRYVAMEFLFKRPWSLNLLGAFIRTYQVVGLQALVRRLRPLRLISRNMEEMECLLPPVPKRNDGETYGDHYPAKAPARYRVGFFHGCVMKVFFDEANRASIGVLVENGCSVTTPEEQRCCGALHQHAGDPEGALGLARRNIEAFGGPDVDFIVVNAPGCSIIMKEYGHLLRHDPEYAERAEGFSEKVRDISEFLVEIVLSDRMGAVNLRVAYDDPCHLLHGQGISEQPREVMRAIPGVALLDFKENSWCCGSAGVYNITHPELSMKLLDRKMHNIMEVSPDIIVTGNPGCLLQLSYGVRRNNLKVPVVHIMQLLNMAYQARDGNPAK